jgi:hypothetical protein
LQVRPKPRASPVKNKTQSPIKNLRTAGGGKGLGVLKGIKGLSLNDTVQEKGKGKDKWDGEIVELSD